jgi:LysR family transcriptional regulator, low CO2-responsive transcriptional regulator
MTTDARLRALVAVADAGSVHDAAGRLMITDSAVSAALAALTREVGVPLLERQGRGLRLTPSGRSYAGYARAILGLHEEALAAARGDADPEHGLVRVAAVTTAAEHIVPPLLATFRDRHPGVEVSLEVGTSERVWGLLGNWGADLVIAGRPPRSLDAAVRALRPNDLVVVGPPGRAGTFDASRATWLMREAGSGTRTTCEALLAALDADPPTLTLGSNGAVVAGAVAGLGVCLVSRDAVVRWLASGDLAELSVAQTPMARPWHAVTRPRPSAVAELLVAHLLQDEPEASGWRRPRPRRPSPRRSTRRGM